MSRTWRALLILVVAASAGCRGRAEQAAQKPELPAFAVTRWTSNTELFAEYPALVLNETSRFAIHVTRLRDFAPVTQGRVTVRLAGPDTKTFSADAPSRPGIFGVDVIPERPGTYQLQIELAGHQVSDTHDLGAVTVYPDTEQAIAHAKPEEAEGISFLKEQQWTLEFGTAVVAERALRESVDVAGQVRPRAGGDAVVSAPIAGRILSAERRPAGSPVRAGEVLAEIVPRSANPGDRATLELEVREATAALELAAAESKRVERLSAEGAVPARRASEAQLAERQARSRLDSARSRLAQFDAVRTGRGAVAAEHRYSVRAPIAGAIVESRATPGSAVEEGNELFRIVAVDSVLVVAHVPEAAASRLAAVAGGELVVEGAAAPVPLGRLLTRGRVIDPRTRTVPLTFEWPRPDPRFAVGQSVQVRLLGDRGAPAPVVPESAVVDDGGRPVVFSQLAGETFERRPVRLGRRESGFVEVVEGLRVGDRVVIRGAPLVRLAALSTSVPAHGHVH